MSLVALVLADQDKQDGGHRYQDFKKHFQPYTVEVDKTFEKEDRFSL